MKAIPGLDAVRALACLWVVAHHVTQRFPPAVRDSQFVSRMLLRGNMGVPIFFVLSGFLLSLPFWKGYDAGRRMPSLRSYFLKRMARIVPGYYVCLIVCLALGAGLVGLWSPRMISALTFTNSFQARFFFPTPTNPPLWSIGIEVLFYLILPVFMAGLFRCKTPAGAWLYGLSVVLLIALLTLITSSGMVGNRADGPVDGGPSTSKDWVISHNALSLFPHFLVGVYAARLYLSSAKARAPRPRLLFDFLSVACLALIFLVDLPRAIPMVWRLQTLGFEYQWPYFHLLVGLLLVALPRSSVVGPFLEGRFLKWTAKLSFGIYIWHFPILTRLDGLFGKRMPYPWNTLLLYPATYLLAYLAAGLSYSLVEGPALAWAHGDRLGRVAPTPVRSEPTS